MKTVKSLLLSTLKILQELIACLESPEGLTSVQEKKCLQAAQPKFKALEQHLRRVIVTQVVRENQPHILRYFIQEATEHSQTLEQGLC